MLRFVKAKTFLGGVELQHAIAGVLDDGVHEPGAGSPGLQARRYDDYTDGASGRAERPPHRNTNNALRLVMGRRRRCRY